MSKSIQIKQVPDSVHRKLKSRAGLKGVSLSDYLIEELRRRLTMEEMLERLSKRSPVKLSDPAEK